MKFQVFPHSNEWFLLKKGFPCSHGLKQFTCNSINSFLLQAVRAHRLKRLTRNSINNFLLPAVRAFTCYPQWATLVKLHYTERASTIPKSYLTWSSPTKLIPKLNSQLVATVSEEQDLGKGRGFCRNLPSKPGKIFKVNCHTPEIFRRMPSMDYNTAWKWRASYPTDVE